MIVYTIRWMGCVLGEYRNKDTAYREVRRLQRIGFNVYVDWRVE